MTAPADRPAEARLTDNQLAALETLVTAAPVGPWSCADELNYHEYVAIIQTAGDWGDIADAYDLDAAAFIVAARQAVPQLIAEVRRTRAALGEYADRSRWQSVAIPLTNGNVRLCATFDGGWGVADAALATDGPRAAEASEEEEQ